jgi:hypothetical protein
MTSCVIDPVSWNDADLVIEGASQGQHLISNPHPSIFVSEKILSATSARKALNPHWAKELFDDLSATETQYHSRFKLKNPDALLSRRRKF